MQHFTVHALLTLPSPWSPTRGLFMLLLAVCWIYLSLILISWPPSEKITTFGGYRRLRSDPMTGPSGLPYLLVLKFVPGYGSFYTTKFSFFHFNAEVLSHGADSLCNLLLRGDPARVMHCAIKHILFVPWLKYFLYMEDFYVVLLCP